MSIELVMLSSHLILIKSKMQVGIPPARSRRAGCARHCGPYLKMLGLHDLSSEVVLSSLPPSLPSFHKGLQSGPRLSLLLVSVAYLVVWHKTLFLQGLRLITIPFSGWGCHPRPHTDFVACLKEGDRGELAWTRDCLNTRTVGPVTRPAGQGQLPCWDGASLVVSRPLDTRAPKWCSNKNFT